MARFGYCLDLIAVVCLYIASYRSHTAIQLISSQKIIRL